MDEAEGVGDSAGDLPGGCWLWTGQPLAGAVGASDPVPSPAEGSSLSRCW